MIVNIKLHLFAQLFSEFGGGCMYSYWMKLAGVTMEGGYANNEASRVYGMLPDTTCVGANSFWGFGSYSTAVSFRDDCMHVDVSRFPEQCFLGNKAVLSGGNYPTDCLVGVGTFVSKNSLRRKMNSHRDNPTTVFGLPIFNMPLRDSQNINSDVNDSPFIPTFFQYVQRFIMYDVAYKVLQGAVICFVFAALRTTIAIAASMTVSGYILGGAYLMTFGVFTALSVIVPLSLVIIIVTLKRVLQLGYRTRSGSYSFWSYDAQVIHFLWYFPDMFLAPMNAIVGNTLLANSLLWRPMGAKIGSKTLLIDHHATDIDLINIGSECVSSHPQYQLHSYEERLLRIGTVRIADHVTLIGAQLMANAKLGSHTTVFANTVVMKSQELLAGQTYAGVPAREVVEKLNAKGALQRRRTNRRRRTQQSQTPTEVEVKVDDEEKHISPSDSESNGTGSIGTVSYPSSNVSDNDDANEDSKYSPLVGAYDKIAAKHPKKIDPEERKSIHQKKESPWLTPQSPHLSPRYSASSAGELMEKLLNDDFTLDHFLPM